MGNNQEIRQRMETYRSILLAFNWIGAVVLVIVGIALASSRYTQGIGIGVIIGSVVIGVIGHFLINVTLAIPFILLNNGDILESMKGNIEKPTTSTKKCPFCAENINNEAKICPHCGNDIQKYENDKALDVNIRTENKQNDNITDDKKNEEIERLEKIFESSTDENEKGVIAKKLYDLGKIYYWRFIPKEKK